MKSIVTLLLSALLVPVLLTAQNGPCRTAMPEGIFRQKHKMIAVQQTDDRKLQAAMDVLQSACLNAGQVKAIAELFIDDFSRLEFARNAFNNTVDPENFYYVYDAFAYFSTVFMLHDYVKESGSHPHDYLPPYEPPLNLNFAALDYPDYRNYNGPTNCRMPISEDEFIRLARQYAFNDNEQNRLNLFIQLTSSNCVSTAMVMKLASLLDNENNRLLLFRASRNNIYDIENLHFGSQLFAHIPNRAAFNELLNNQGGVVVIPDGPCRIGREQFEDMIESVRKETFNSTKLTIAKSIIKGNPCFMTTQVRDLVKEFSFESGKLEIAKFAYEYTIDKENYYRVADVFGFSSSKEELLQYIESRK